MHCNNYTLPYIVSTSHKHTNHFDEMMNLEVPAKMKQQDDDTDADSMTASDNSSLYEKEIEEDLTFCKIGITDQDILFLQSTEVISSDDHVCEHIGDNGHYVLRPRVEGGVVLPESSCHVRNIDQVYDPECFASGRQAPLPICTLQDKETFSKRCPVKAVEDLLVKIPGSDEYHIPNELVQFEEAIQVIIDCFHKNCQRTKDNYFCYLSCISMVTPPGSFQSFRTIHADGLLGVKHMDKETGKFKDEVPMFFSVSDTLPTEFFVENLDLSHLDLTVHDFSKYFDKTIKERKVPSTFSRPYEVIMWDGYALHRSAQNTGSEAIPRCFVHVEFATRLYDSQDTSKNTAFIYPERVLYGRHYMGHLGGWGGMPAYAFSPDEDTPEETLKKHYDYHTENGMYKGKKLTFAEFRREHNNKYISKHLKSAEISDNISTTSFWPTMKGNEEKNHKIRDLHVMTSISGMISGLGKTFSSVKELIYSGEKNPIAWEYLENNVVHDHVEGLVDAFPRKGISINGLRSFVSAHYEQLVDLSTGQMCSNIILPLTFESQSSLVELVEANECRDEAANLIIADANIFISHAWSYRFMDVYLSLEKLSSTHPDRRFFFWFDTMTVNQHRAKGGHYDSKWYSTTFKTGVASIGETCVVMSPWDHPRPLTRSWCLWEILCTIMAGSDLKIQIFPSEEDKFMSAVKEDVYEVISSLTKIDMEKAEAFMPSDRDMIKLAVKDSVGFAYLNAIIGSKLQNWVGEYAMKMIPTDISKSLPLVWSVAKLLQGVNRLKASESLCRDAHSIMTGKSKSVFGKSFNTNHRLMEAKLNLADCLRLTSENSKIKEAKTLVDDCAVLVHQLESHLVDTYAERLVILKADLLKELKANGSAKEMYQQWLAGHTVGENTPMIEKWVKMQLAMVLWDMGDSKEADALYVDCINLWKKHYDSTGERHTNMYLCHGSYSTFLISLDRLDEAEMHMRITLKGRRETLGEDHSLTLRSYYYCAYLLFERSKKALCFDYTEALRAARISFDGRQKKLGKTHKDTLASVNLLRELEEAENLCSFSCTNLFPSFFSCWNWEQ